MPNTRILVLYAAFALGVLYLLEGQGMFDAPYPASVALKASGIVLLSVYALLSGAPVLAAALGFCAIGDAALDLEPSQLQAGIGAFGVGHLIYLSIFANRIRMGGLRTVGWPVAIAAVVAGLAMLLWLRPHMGEVQTPATIYNLIIIVMVASACLARGPMLAPLGALLFFLSDAILATRMFVGAPDWSGPMVWIFYFGGQVLLAVGIVRGLRGQPAAERASTGSMSPS